MNKNKKIRIDTSIIVYLIIGIILGIVIIFALDDLYTEMNNSGFGIFSYFIDIALFVVAYMIQIVIHEMGHLIAGLLTGYGFASFRIGDVMLLKNKDGYSIKRYSLAGTAGQCLMTPPEKDEDGNYPYKLYHLGGVILNAITSIVFLVIFLSWNSLNIVSELLSMLAITGIICALTNGIPMKTMEVANDGYNAFNISKDLNALNIIWLQLKINELQNDGIRIKDMPDEYFELPDNLSKDNEIVTTGIVYKESRAMDRYDFEEAKRIIDQIENEGYKVIGLYKYLLLMDKATIELMEQGNEADISYIEGREIMNFRRSMAKFPSVIRLEYAVALLKDNDINKANYYRQLLNDIAITYPLKQDIEAELDIMKYIDKALLDKQTS